MRRDRYQLHMTSSLSSSPGRHQCPVMSRLYTPVDDDARVSCDDGDAGVFHAGMRRLPAAAAELMDCADSSGVCDDVFCVHVDDDDRHQRHKHFFHVWAQYRIAQRGIMVGISFISA